MSPLIQETPLLFHSPHVAEPQKQVVILRTRILIRIHLVFGLIASVVYWLRAHVQLMTRRQNVKNGRLLVVGMLVLVKPEPVIVNVIKPELLLNSTV